MTSSTLQISPDSQSLSRSTSTPDQRPRVAIGHIGLSANDVQSLAAFYSNLGTRLVLSSPGMAIVELRGGTHIVVQAGGHRPGRSLDLMVDDIDDLHRDLQAAGAEPTQIVRGNPHDRFTAVDPEGNRLHLSSSHAMGPV